MILLAGEVYRKGIVPAGIPVDLEISLDETEETTTPEAHFFVSHELQRLGICGHQHGTEIRRRVPKGL